MQAGGQRFDPAQLHQVLVLMLIVEVLGEKNKVCTALIECVPVLSKIVKRRYVRMNEQSFMPIGFVAVGSFVDGSLAICVRNLAVFAAR